MYLIVDFSGAMTTLTQRISSAMKKILFVCLGNICHSPMAEFVMKDLAGCVGGMPRTSERIIAGAR